MARLTSLWQRTRWILLLLIVQSVNLVLVFDDMVLEPGAYLFSNQFDGMRQYYFYQAYVDQTPDQSWLKVEEVGYPYGEYHVYTDGTPLLAFFTRVVSTYLVDLRDHATDVHFYFVLLGRLLSTLLVFWILRRLGVRLWMALLFALALPWINGEILKLGGGQMNLSFSWPFLLTIYVGLRIYQAHAATNIQVAYRWAILFAVVISLTSFLHLYWLPLTTVVLGFTLFSYQIYLWRNHKDVLPLVGYGLTACVSPWVVVLGILRMTDGYFSTRVPRGEGYGWERWVFELSGYHSSHPWNSVRFIIEDKDIIAYGAHMYLGNFALFFAVLLLVMHFLRRPVRLDVRSLMRQESEGSYFRWLLVGAAVSVLISLGEQITLWDRSYVLNNYLNLFFYLHKLSDRITQFRDVSRFAFIGWWWFNLLAVYLFDRWLRTHIAVLVRIAAILLMLLLVLDTKDAFRYLHRWPRPNLLYQRDQSQIDELISDVDMSAYQAAFSIPYFHEGAGDNHYVIDGFDDLITSTFQLQRWGDTPLLCSKFARGNKDHALQLLSIFQGDSTGKGISPELLANLDDRPILVLYDEDFYNGKRQLTGNQSQPAWDLLQRCHEIIERYDMTEIKRQGHLRLYRWDVARFRER